MTESFELVKLKTMRSLPFSAGQKGQTVLIVLLIMTVVLTIGLSTISSSITDIRISQQTEESTRAFYVAESALEEKMQSAAAASSGSLDGIGYVVTSETLGGQYFVFPEEAASGDTQTLWLVGHNAEGQIDESSDYNGGVTFYWGTATSAESSALSVAYIYRESGVYKIARYNFDPDAARRLNNRFTAALTQGFTVAGRSLKYSTGLINLPNNANIQPFFIRATLSYNSSPQLIAAAAAASPYFPNQGSCYVSTATVSQSGITRKVRQCRFWQEVPSIFNWGLFSGGNLEKSL